MVKKIQTLTVIGFFLVAFLLFNAYVIPKEFLTKIALERRHHPNTKIVATALGKHTLTPTEVLETKRNTSLSIVISYCKISLDWIPKYVGDYSYDVTDITIISKCGKEVDGLEELAVLGAPINIIKLRNTGRCDHSFAYWIKHNREKINERKDGENLVLFTKDNPRQMDDYRSTI